MKKKVRFAVISSGTPSQLPGTNVITVTNLVSVCVPAYGVDPVDDAVRKLITRIVDRYPYTKLNCILGFNVVPFYDGTNRRFAAYGNPAYIEHIEGLKGEIHIPSYEIEV